VKWIGGIYLARECWLIRSGRVFRLHRKTGFDVAQALSCEQADIPRDKASFALSLVPPPSEELEVLLQLAMAGNMRDIRQRADYLAKLDKRYVPFAEKLRRLAAEYHSESILNMIENCMKKPQVIPDATVNLPRIISHVVWLYFRFSLSLRDIEELMASRGIVVTFETIRQWDPEVRSAARERTALPVTEARRTP
jgi:hypothetical protein